MTESLDKIREYNIIWDFSENYKFTPKKTYPMDEVFKNIVAGFTIKTFDTKMLESFFAYLYENNPFYEDFKFMTNLLIEDICVKELKKDNLVIGDLQRKFAQKSYGKYSHHNPDNLREQVEKAYYGQVLGKPIIEGAIFRNIYMAVFAIYTTDTSALIDKLNEVFKTYFRFDRTKEDEELFEEMVKDKEAKEFKNSEEKPSEYSDENIDQQFAIGSAEFTGNIYYADKKEDLNKNLLFLNSSQDDYLSLIHI